MKAHQSSQAKNRRAARYFRDVPARDGWQCRMPVCLHPEEDGGRAIDPALQGTDSPWKPSVDHVIRLRDGGTWDQDNLRAAHYRCNQADGREGES
jgi:5-methylcytosine-specific restriction endonuclease McrA